MVRSASPEPRRRPRPCDVRKRTGAVPDKARSPRGPHTAAPQPSPGPAPAPSSPGAPGAAGLSGAIAALGVTDVLSFLPQMFVKYLQPSERLGVFLAAIKSMRAPNPRSTKLAAHMVDVLAAETDFHSGQVLNIVWAIYRTLPSVRAALALQSLDRALLELASKRPRETVASLLQCSPTCTRYGARQGSSRTPPKTSARPEAGPLTALGSRSVAVTMWRAMVSQPPATEKVLQELLRVLMNRSQRTTSTSIRENPRILTLADGAGTEPGCFLQAARTVHEILQLPSCLKEAKAIFPQLFLALLVQVSFTTELTLQEVQVFRQKHRQDLLTPIRSTVQSLKALLRSVGLGSQVLAIEAQGGWAALLSAESHLWGVQVVAREMKELPGSLRATIIRHLAELLSMEDSSWEMVAMVFLSKMLECTDLGNELDCVVSLFATYLRSQCLGMQSLVLRAILGLTERPDTVSRGSRQHHECSGLGWAGPGLLWLGTFPGSGEGAAGGRRCASIPAPPALFLWGCAGQPCRPAPRCPMGRRQREGWDRRVFSPRWQALLYPKEGVFFTQARQTLVLLPSITEQLQGADSDTRTVALPVLSTMLRLLEGRTLSLTALGLAGKLPSLFDDESSAVRVLSVRLFLDTLGFVESSEKKKMQKEVCRSLLPLSFHLHDQDESVAEASREALLGVARFLRWRQLAHLAETVQTCKIGECLLARRRSGAEEYLGQSLPYLQSLQEPLRREAVRFIGLVGRHLVDQRKNKSQYICEGEPGRGIAGQPPGDAPVPCSLLAGRRAGGNVCGGPGALRVQGRHLASPSLFSQSFKA
ncbi:maestro heat-like repeat-containing protein family member 7 [Cygnus olor]|uniref:maestro heat-like repeat-containing protein family member 7 n=1 Tax=Cygnus olor TaxID=8869 RepID=UPI001ADE2A4C|nr:maestro heat-like repeat-containing protein family member 7 [Cygnus olor]